MNFKKRFSIFVCLFSAISLPSISSLAIESDDLQASIIGEAFDSESGELKYRELHFLSPDLKSRRVAYHGPGGELLAEKNLNFGGSIWQPNMDQENRTCGETISVVFSDDLETLDIEYQASSNAKLKRKTIKSVADLVVDAGFDSYLQENWQRLIEGDTIRFYYLAPSQLGIFLFQAEKFDCTKGAGQQCFVVKPKKWWMRVLLDPIIVSYEKESRNLLSFKGLGNIADENCDYMKVDIRYQYRDF